MTTMGGVRRSDPATSRAAAESMSGPVLAGQKLAVLRQIDALDWWTPKHSTLPVEGATAYEVVHVLAAFIEGLPSQQSVASKRCSELARKGLIYDTGERRLGESNRYSTVWRVSEKGREALRRAEEVSR